MKHDYFHRYAVSSWLVWVALFTTGPGCVSCEEVVNGTVTAGSSNQSMPLSVSLDTVLDGRNIHLNLSQDSDVNLDLPVYVLTDNAGKPEVTRAQLEDVKDFAVYNDVEHGAAFQVSREMLENGTSHLNMEGVVHLDGKVFDLKTVGQQSDSNNTLLERIKRDVSDDRANRTHHSYIQNSEEFKVHVLNDTPADLFDSLPAPLNIQKWKKMRNSTFSQPVLLVPPSERRKRQTVTQDVYIDVVALADFAVYTNWYKQSTATTTSAKQTDALQKIRQYYAFIFNGVNMLYKSITTLQYAIHVRLSSVVVATTASSSPFTERYRQTAAQWDEVDANSALEHLAGWVPTASLPKYDHIMLFTGYDLTKVALGVKSDRITGLAYTATACSTSGKATSIVEDLGGFQCIATAAHELGHGLSAEHDGSENNCRSEDRYIMSAGTFDETAQNKRNPWMFSTCSVNYFNNFIRNQVRSQTGQLCLYNTLATESSVPDVTSVMPGQLYNADEQCRQVYGPSSRLCRGPEFGVPADICTEMYCFDPTTTSTCFMLVAARGTTCGNKQWCDKGQCVYDGAAPAADENCVLGDQPGVAFENADCATFVARSSAYCYQDVVKERCCQTCGKYYLPIQNCQYGDKALGCSSLGCRQSISYKESCCRTCQYGSPMSSSTTRPIISNPVQTSTRPMTANPLQTTSRLTVSVVNNVKSTPDITGACVDDVTVTINQKECSVLVTMSPEMCYNSKVQTYCCASCRNIFTGVKGCEYGDRVNCSSIVPSVNSCMDLMGDCCRTCSDLGPTGGPISVGDAIRGPHLLSLFTLLLAYFSIHSDVL